MTPTGSRRALCPAPTGARTTKRKRNTGHALILASSRHLSGSACPRSRVKARLGVQSIGGDHDAGQVYARQQDGQGPVRRNVASSAAPRPMPRVVSVWVVVWASHWPIAVNPLAPARTAQTATAISALSRWRRPRGLSGSGTRVRTWRRWSWRERGSMMSSPGWDDGIRVRVPRRDGSVKNFHPTGSSTPAPACPTHEDVGYIPII